MTAVNLGLAFLLELAALAGLAVWGVHAGGTLSAGRIGKVALGVGAPLLAAVVWGAFVAPKASVQLSGGVKFAIASAVFAAGAGGLAESGRWQLGIALAGVFLANQLALTLLGAG
jgi:hypothetical protein